VLYLAIPAHNEDATIGVLLWRLRTVLAEFPREYEVVVYDDASTDDTAAVAEQYTHAMPVTVLRGGTPVGYAGAVNALARHIAGLTRYPRRDAMLLLQGDFTDPPGIVPEFARRFEGGADLVVGERTAVVDAPVPVRRLFTAAGWALKPFVRVEGLRDLTGSMRLIRISALRDLLRTVGERAVCEGDSWTANADLLLQLVPHARRIETVPVEPTYGVRTRETRRVTVRDALAALRWGWRARGRRPVPSSAAPDTVSESNTRSARGAGAPVRRDDVEVTAERLRERSKDRDRHRPESSSPARREARPDRRDNTTPDESKSARRAEPTNAPRPSRGERTQERTQERTERTTDKQGRRSRAASPTVDASAVLDDPFAAPVKDRSAPPAGGATTVPPAPAASTHGPTASPLGSPDIPARNDDRPTHDSPVGVEPEGDEASPETAAGSAADGEGVRERKRRRNRRSRRRRSRLAEDGSPGADTANGASTGDESGDDSSDDAGDDAFDDTGENAGDHRRDQSRDATGMGDDAETTDERAPRTPREARSRNRRRRRRGGERRAESGDAAPSAAERDGADDYSDGSASERDDAASGRHRERDGEGDGEHDGDGERDGDGADGARARRRGRRGRRGGARRARGRGNAGGDAGGEAGGTGDAPSQGDGE
jgi:hypothetical protein